jgi:hypothetical protein
LEETGSPHLSTTWGVPLSPRDSITTIKTKYQNNKKRKQRFASLGC